MDNTRCPWANTFLWYVLFLTPLFWYVKVNTFNWIIPDLVGLQTKGKFACPICGPKMKSHHSKSLRKQVFDENRHFLHINHKYQIIEKHLFNGKEETTSKPQRIKPHLWNLTYNKINFWGNVIPFDGFCFKFIFRYCVLFTDDVIDACEGRQGINDQLPKGLKIYPMQFTRLPYYEKLPIVHLFDPMHIRKNVT